MRHLSSIFLVFALTGCSPDIPMQAPTQLAVKQVGYGPSAAVEVSWRVVTRAGAYLLGYGQRKGGPYDGAGLRVVRWPVGCGDFDGGTAPVVPDSGPADSGLSDASPPLTDAGWTGYSANSPVRIPAYWCLERAHTYSDAGFQPATTPAARPRVRLDGLTPGKAYYFTVRSFRLASTSVQSSEAAFTPLAQKGSK